MAECVCEGWGKGEGRGRSQPQEPVSCHSLNVGSFSLFLVNQTFQRSLLTSLLSGNLQCVLYLNEKKNLSQKQ